MFGAALYGCHATFKAPGVFKALKISMTTKNFLKEVIERQQSWTQKRIDSGKQQQPCVQLVSSMMGQYQKIVNLASIDQVSYDFLMKCNAKLKQELIVQQGQIYLSDPDQIWFDWFAIIQAAVAQLHIYSRSNDLQWLQQQLQTFDQIIRSHSWDNALLQKIVMRIFELSNEIMRLFDGTFVDDFDLLVLNNLIVMFMVLRC